MEPHPPAPPSPSAAVRRRSGLAFALLAFAAAGCATGCAIPADSPRDPFTGTTLRIELTHAFDAAGIERFAIERQVDDGPWAGARERIDDSNLGSYRVELRHAGDAALLYARGFSSVFGEWRTTADARLHPDRVFHEAVRVPRPAVPVRLRILVRGADQRFTVTFDEPLPRAPVAAAAPPRDAEVVALSPLGPLHERVDLLVLGDAYLATERERFLADARRLTDELFAHEPYRSHRARFNVRAVFTPSVVDTPALGFEAGAFGLDRYVLARDERPLREAAAAAPYEALLVLVDQEEYGGGGIYELYCCAAAGAAEAGFLVVHEFGHSFAALGDEYYASVVAYEDWTRPGTEPWEPNATARPDPATLKWRHLVTPGAVVPTPWDQAGYDGLDSALAARRAALRQDGVDGAALAAELAAERERRLAAIFAPHAGVVGAFEGALYAARGLYRPAVDCVMFRRGATAFCAVCKDAIERRIAESGASNRDDSSRVETTPDSPHP
jgi:hypothetical protein